MCAFGCWAGIKMFLHEKGACQNDMKTVSLQFYSVFGIGVRNRKYADTPIAVFAPIRRYADRRVCADTPLRRSPCLR